MSKQPFFAKNERITNIFSRIAKSVAVAILYQWVSNTFDTHIILKVNGEAIAIPYHRLFKESLYE